MSAVFALLLLLFFDSSVAVALILILIFLVLVNGGRSISLSIAALRMRRKIDAGVYSTLVNAVASVAAGVSPKIITRLLDDSSLSTAESWRLSFLIILLINVGIILILALLAIWVKLINRKKSDLV